jgi:hypothetical protein
MQCGGPNLKSVYHFISSKNTYTSYGWPEGYWDGSYGCPPTTFGPKIQNVLWWKKIQIKNRPILTLYAPKLKFVETY